MSEIQKFPNLVRGGGGVSIFQKCLKLKNVSIWSEGGGSAFFKNVGNSKMSQRSEGGGQP